MRKLLLFVTITLLMSCNIKEGKDLFKTERQKEIEEDATKYVDMLLSIQHPLEAFLLINDNPAKNKLEKYKTRTKEERIELLETIKEVAKEKTKNSNSTLYLEIALEAVNKEIEELKTIK
ncbi:hypothetical protein IR083_19380 [Dysgonomonas sp. GY75]|uniref:hypothetical protein n=1 Tax=Dysgonomonas sp. GY75 TaxID=2780419 RepID=UPI0018846826|nr:hypothetical protein [Dysgonomonas sp. GY75]MBF0650984.1 hypothetical protein [Dysgonomonas sp. GY75]